jgi:hypothetical protein
MTWRISRFRFRPTQDYWLALRRAQEAAPEEIVAIREWLNREGACPLLAPHHDVGFDCYPVRAQTPFTPETPGEKPSVYERR